MHNLSEGFYLFELTVTDDKGATGKDTVQITVNTAANISPTANAGGDKTITLPPILFLSPETEQILMGPFPHIPGQKFPGLPVEQ